MDKLKFPKKQSPTINHMSLSNPQNKAQWSVKRNGRWWENNEGATNEIIYSTY